MFSLSNERPEFAKNLTILLRVMYIYEGDLCKKYEIRLRPGEYQYNEIVGKVKERV